MKWLLYKENFSLQDFFIYNLYAFQAAPIKFDKMVPKKKLF